MIDEEMEHAGALKRQLVHFGEAKRFASDLVEAQFHYFDSPDPVSNPQYVSFLDYFLLQYRLSDGLTVVDHFVNDTPSLPQADKDILIGWKSVVEGLFEILRHEGDVLVFDNLLNDVVYRVRSNMGRAYFDKMLPGHYIRARIVPMGAVWMLSGAITMYPRAGRNEVLRASAEAVVKQPFLLYRNPAKREQAIKLQTAEKSDFVAFFGSNLVVVPVNQLAETMKGYMSLRAQMAELEALPIPGSAPVQALPPFLPPLHPNLQYENRTWAKDVETIGITFDEIEGMEYHPNLGLVVEAFADPEKVKGEPCRKVVSDYVQNPDVSLLPIRILADRAPERATRVIRNLLPLPDFEWDRDGDNLLRQYRPDYEQRMQPSAIPLSDRLIEALQLPLPPDAPPPGKKAGRNEPCPCGSGKKYKQCCG